MAQYKISAVKSKIRRKDIRRKAYGYEKKGLLIELPQPEKYAVPKGRHGFIQDFVSKFFQSSHEVYEEILKKSIVPRQAGKTSFIKSIYSHYVLREFNLVDTVSVYVALDGVFSGKTLEERKQISTELLDKFTQEISVVFTVPNHTKLIEPFPVANGYMFLHGAIAAAQEDFDSRTWLQSILKLNNELNDEQIEKTMQILDVVTKSLEVNQHD